MEFGNRNVGSVKAAINLFGERVLDGRPPASDKRRMNFVEGSSSKAKELLTAKTDLNKFEESKISSDSTKARAETELLEAKNTVKTLRSMIEESNSKLKSQLVNEFKRSKGPRKPRYQYDEVMKELELVKKELSKFKLDMVSVTKEKSRAENEADVARGKLEAYSSSMEALVKEIEEVNEELVLVELARIEAVKEHGEIEAEREKEEKEYMKVIQEMRMKMEEIREEIEGSQEVEDKLGVTLSDIEVLQVGLQLSREMEKRVERIKDSGPSVGPVVAELEAAKKRLDSIKEEGFQVMASMDVVTIELQRMVEENIKLKKDEEEIDLKVRNLNSKIMRARAKLESVSEAEETASSITSNLSATLGSLRGETEGSKKEKEVIYEEIRAVKEETERTENSIEPTEDMLQAAMAELEAAKSSEGLALEELRVLTERTMRQRSLASRHGPWIKIARFEYEYLQGRAARAEEIADKKVAAADAWVEALRASEREISMKSEIISREVKEMRVEEEVPEIPSLGTKLGTESRNLPVILERKYSRKSTGEFGPYSTPGRRVGARKSISLAGRSPSFTMKRKPKVMPNFSKYFIEKKLDSEVYGTS